MIAFGITIARFMLLAVLLAGTPLLLAIAVSAPGDPWSKRLSNAGLHAVGLTLMVALGLHIARIPITAASLATAHLSLAAIALLATLIRFRHTAHRPQPTASASHSAALQPPTANRPRSTLHSPLSTVYGLLFLLLLLFHWTHFTGIDTYKWQDLATSVRMEQSLPWIVHPLSLAGFTPRAYPPAHPVLLATVQIVGNLGVDGGFAVVSWLIALLGVASATRLAGCVFPPRLALAAGLLYGFAPVFMRYAHWATGRGLFLAVFPVFVALLIESRGTGKTTRGSVQKQVGNVFRGEVNVGQAPLPVLPSKGLLAAGRLMLGGRARCHDLRFDIFGIRRLVAVGVVGALLLLTHKVALVAVPLVLLAALVAACLPVRRLPLVVRIAVTLPFLLAAAAMVTPALLPGLAGLPGGLVRTAVVRFGWMLPFALVGLWLAPAVSDRQPTPYAGRFLFLCALPALPLAFERQMYGALYALPFICLFAVDGFQALVERVSPSVRVWCVRVVVTLTLAGALATVGARSRIACPPPLFRAAMFLEAYDPAGPFMVHAPGLARTRVLAYVSGCARFDVRAVEGARPQWPALPPLWRGTLRTTVDAWAGALRGLVTLDDTTVDWYGNPRTHYHFVINGRGGVPSDAECIYDREGIAIYRTQPARID